MTGPIRAFVCGCASLELADGECRFIEATQPWGLILFKRNVGSPDQLRALTKRFRECVGRSDAPVLVDQEGGRVQRLGAPLWSPYPAAAIYQSLGSEQTTGEAAELGGRLIATDLREAGITVDCAPVLDVPVPDVTPAIGSRAFGPDPDTVARLGHAFARGLLGGGVLPVIKHMPGHGRAVVDSHYELPVVTAGRRELEAVDFAPFRALRDLPIAMTAHVVFTAIDPQRPATTSAIVIRSIIREWIGFEGLLISDDLSMEALKGSLGERASAAAEAGCDILLHCNGKLDEAMAVAAQAKPLEGLVAGRAERALDLVADHRLDCGSEDNDRQRFATLTASAA